MPLQRFKPVQKPYSRNGEVLDERVFPSEMQRIALGIEYNGSLFHGFQYQKSGVATVQQALEASLSAIADETIAVSCAGRTDAGVHGTNQVVHFDTLAKRPVKAWLRGANTYLADGVSIRWMESVSCRFHARFSAQSRCYRYVIYNHPTPSALLHKQVTWDRRRLDVAKMNAAGQLLIGEHDFNAFRATQCQAKTSIRRMDKINIHRQNDFIVIEVQANAFLYHMVRNIVGVLCAIGAGQAPVTWAGDVLKSMDRRCAGVTAPADGLYLVDVQYSDEFGLPHMSKGPYFINDNNN